MLLFISFFTPWLIVLLVLMALAAIVVFYLLINAPEYDENENFVPGPGLNAVEFEGQNTVIAKDQPQYRPLPAFVQSSVEGEVITCWHIPFWERVKLLFTGKLWLSVWTFRNPLQPLFLSVHRRDVLTDTPRENGQNQATYNGARSL